MTNRVKKNNFAFVYQESVDNLELRPTKCYDVDLLFSLHGLICRISGYTKNYYTAQVEMAKYTALKNAKLLLFLKYYLIFYI